MIVNLLSASNHNNHDFVFQTWSPCSSKHIEKKIMFRMGPEMHLSSHDDANRDPRASYKLYNENEMKKNDIRRCGDTRAKKLYTGTLILFIHHPHVENSKFTQSCGRHFI